MENILNSLASQWDWILFLILFATLHGYAAAWLAVRMLFRPRKPIKFLGITIVPQGMIPRHKSRMAKAIGKAVGQELVSQETVLEELFEKEFLQNKIQVIVDSYTNELVTTIYPSLIESLPDNLRDTVLTSVDSIVENIGIYLENIINSQETIDSVQFFVEERVDEILSQKFSDAFTDKTYNQIVNYAESLSRKIVREDALEEKIKDFIGIRLDDLANTKTPLKEMFTDEAISLLKEKATEQIEPIVRQLADLATEKRTKNQISALIKKEVHSYYEQLPFVKKMFVSRDTLLKEVDDLVDESLPKRIEETLQGEFFAEEAEVFVSKTIDNSLERPLPDLIGKVAPEQIDSLKNQVTNSILSTLRGDEIQNSISAYLTDSLEKMRPQKLGNILHKIHPETSAKIKITLSNGFIKTLKNQDTSTIIQSVLSQQIKSLIHQPIGKLSDYVSEDKIKSAGNSLTNSIISAARKKLPEVIQEFDIGGVVEEKVNNYPAEKLESLVLSIAKDHLRKIELFGAVLGFILGAGQAIFYLYSYSN